MIWHKRTKKNKEEIKTIKKSEKVKNIKQEGGEKRSRNLITKGNNPL